MPIIPSITTSNFEITDIQVEELKKLDVKKIGLFLTGMHFHSDRMNLIKTLHSIGGITCPLVHVRIDSKPEELEFCLEHFNTQFFNLHAIHEDNFIKSDIYKFKDKMLAENSRMLTKKQVDSFAGICLDLSHYFEDSFRNKEVVEDIQHAIKHHPIYCNHISAVRKDKKNWYSEHIGNYNSDFDYLKKIPGEYFGTVCSCMELETSITKQLNLIAYIYTILPSA